MKPLSDVNVLLVDYGTFLSLGECMAEKCQTVHYYSPMESEYRDLKDCCIGTGLANVQRVDDFLDPSFLETLDLAIFPDIGWGGLQKLLRSMGKSVWGSMGFSDYELFRTRFLATVEKLGLDVPAYHVCHGLTELSEYLKTVSNKWVKINRYRANMETWKHLDYEHSIPELNRLHGEFGGCSESVVFVVMDDLPDAVEIGYDGWCVNGEFPESSYQGYEKKNELYLGSLRPYAKLPQSVRDINSAFAPLLKEYRYCNFWSSEIRCLPEGDYFIDPTPRMPGQTGEQLLETCANLADVIWHGANGELIRPVFDHPFAAEATLHYTAGKADSWKVLRVPEEIAPMVKLYQYCLGNGLAHFPPAANDEVGVILGVGETADEAIDNLKDNFDAFDGEPVEIHPAGFLDLIDEIKKAEEEGIQFSDQAPSEPSAEVALA